MPLAITVLIDHPGSYLHDYIEQLLADIRARGHALTYVTELSQIPHGDLLFILGCKSILPNDLLTRHKHNLVVHPSKLPEGKGSAALVNKILAGENTVYLTLFEATEQVDAGDYYYQESITFEGHELSDEIRRAQTMKVFELVLRFIDEYPHVTPHKQEGPSNFFPRRTPKDSKLDIDKSIREQFDLLRIVDNRHYPAFFEHRGHTYVLRIFKQEDLPS